MRKEQADPMSQSGSYLPFHEDNWLKLYPQPKSIGNISRLAY